MSITLTPDQKNLAAVVREFATERISPYRRQNDQERSYRPEQLQQMAAAGLFSLRIPSTHGGQGLDATSVGLALEELARADLSVCFPVLNAALVGRVLADNSTPQQIDRWLPAIASGKALTCLALTETDHGTDAASIEMAAERRDNETWVLNGEKDSIMAATYATHGLVFVRTGGQGSGGISAFYVDMTTPGINVERLDDLGCRAGGRARIIFRNVVVSHEEMVGSLGNGFGAILKGFSVSRAWIALMALSVAGVCIDEALSYASRREAFGKILARHQSVTFPLVEHYTYIHSARALAFEALQLADQGEDPRVATNMAKWWAPKASVDAVQQSLLTMGHRGWSEEGPIAQRLRDVIGLQLADGTAAATKMVVARALLGRDQAP